MGRNTELARRFGAVTGGWRTVRASGPGGRSWRLKQPPQSPRREGAEMVTVGAVLRAHGLRGEVLVAADSDNPDRFGAGAELFAEVGGRLRPLEVATSRPHRGMRLVRFADVADRDGRRSAPRRRARRDRGSGAGRRGRRLSTTFSLSAAGSSTGSSATSARVVEGGGGRRRRPAREVAAGPGDGGRSVLVPFANALLPEIDVGRRLIGSDLPEGLLEDMRVDVVTIFPAVFREFLETSLIGRAIAAGLLEVRVHDLRDYTEDPHRSVDDEPYGGGGGMVMTAPPWLRAVRAVTAGGPRPHRILLSPQGERLDDAKGARPGPRGTAGAAVRTLRGGDERVRTLVVDSELSIGDYVLSGGEVPAMVVGRGGLAAHPGGGRPAGVGREREFPLRPARPSALHPSADRRGAPRCRRCCARETTRASTPGGGSSAGRDPPQAAGSCWPETCRRNGADPLSPTSRPRFPLDSSPSFRLISRWTALEVAPKASNRAIIRSLPLRGPRLAGQERPAAGRGA